MKRTLLSIISLTSLSLFAQKGPNSLEKDTLRIQEIEDIHLHKTGNPNKARSFTTKSFIPLIENPQPIQLVTHEIIEQQQAKQLSDVIKNVNGIYITSSRGGSQDSFGGRGFTFGNENMFKNGTKVNSGIFPEVSGLERVEVLKGANALLYGNVGPGGIINMVTKKPRFNFGGSLGMNVGSWNSYKPTVDIYVPLSEKMAFRVNGTYEYAESFRDVVNSQKQYFNPSFAFNIGKNTQIFVEGDYLKHHFTPDFGTGSLMDSKTGISSFETGLAKTKFLGEDWNYQTNQMATAGITLNHKFNDKWYLNSVASYQNYTKDYFSLERIQWQYDGTNTASTPTWKRALNKTYSEQNFSSLQFNINGELNTGKMVHKVLIGADGDYGVADAYTFFDPSNNKTFGTSYIVGNWVLNNPETWTHFEMPNSAKNTRNRVKTTRFGVYAQDFVEISDMVKILAGIRYSNLKNDNTLETNYKTNTSAEKPKTGTHDFAFSPKAGLIITPNDNFSLYGTYTNSFVPNTGFTINDEPLKPSVVDQFEIGIKKNIWNNAVALNINAYQITNNNTYQTSLTDTTLKEYAGKVRSRGVELDITGNPTPQLSLIGGISYNHSVYLETPENFGYVENQRLVRTPATTINGSAFYKFDKTMKGLIVGASAFYTGDRKAGWNDTKNQTQITRMVDLKGFTTVDLSLGYEYKNILLQGKMGNIFNTENYNVHENYSVNPITPRNFYFTLTYKL